LNRTIYFVEYKLERLLDLSMEKASVKVEGGKLVRVKIKDSKVYVTGDFFIEPAAAREEIEAVLESSKNRSEEEIVEEVQNIDAELIGFSAEDVAEAFIKALEGEKE
jgi:hypothetical protein